MCDEYKKDYLNMDIIDLKEKFTDKRGFIQPLCDLNMRSASLINTKAAQSRIQDADFAAETSNLTKAQMLSQAATSMLAQANASKQNLLALLQG